MPKLYLSRVGSTEVGKVGQEKTGVGDWEFFFPRHGFPLKENGGRFVAGF